MNSFIHLNNSQSCSGLLSKHSCNGKTQEKSKLLKLKEGIGDMSTAPFQYLRPLTRKEQLSTLGFLLPSKSQIFKDKLRCCKQNIPTMKLSKKLDQASISNAEDSCPFWTTSLQEKYQTLWLPTETDCQDLALSCLNTSLRDVEHPSQYIQIQMSKSLSNNSQKTFFRSLRFSQPDTTEAVPTERMVCKKIRFYPNEDQTKLLNKCLGASRFFYNRAVSVLKDKGVKNGMLNLATLRPLVMESDDKISSIMAWQKEVPYDTRQEAISEAIAAFKACITNKRNGNIQTFEVGYRSKKAQTSQAFRVNKKAFNLKKISLFPARLGKKKTLRLRKRDKVKLEALERVDNNFIVQKTRPNAWYLCIPKNKEVPIYDNAIYKSVFLDPGVRTFQTFYSPDGICGKIGSNFSKSLESLADRHDYLWSVSSKAGNVNSKTKRHIRARCAKLRHKLKSKVSDLHNQTCSFLCDTFQKIFLPRFEVANMVLGSPLGSNITRKMLQLSHGAFREKLLAYASSKHREVFLVGEEYTTKTCGCCGSLNHHVGGDKVFKCSSCNLVIDRDYSGARNVCLKLVSKFI